MRALVQRVDRAAVSLPGGETRAISRGLLIYLGVGRGDTPETALKLCRKISGLRIFSNADGKFDRSLLDEKGEALVISQFTLYGDPTGGRRPDFSAAAQPGEARALYERFVELLGEDGVPVHSGEFGAKMSVDSVNDGPVTLWLDTALF